MLFFPNVLVYLYIFIEPKSDKSLRKNKIFVKKRTVTEVEVLGNCSNSRKGFHKAASHWRLQSKIFAHNWHNISKTFNDNHCEKKTHRLQTILVLINSITAINAQWWISWDMEVLCTDCANTVELCKNKMG